MMDLVYQIPPELRVWLIVGPFVVLGLIATIASILTKHKHESTKPRKTRRKRLTSHEVARMQMESARDVRHIRHLQDMDYNGRLGKRE